MLIGYARAAFKDQDLEHQKLLLQEAGCTVIHTDTDETNEKKSSLKKTLSQLESGDVLVVPSLDRLGRTTKELVILIKALASQNIHFLSLNDSIDTRTPECTFLKSITALVAMDDALLKEQTRLSMATARKRGGIGGRKRSMTKVKVEAAKALFSQGMPPTEVASYLGVSIPTLYRWCPASERI